MSPIDELRRIGVIPVVELPDPELAVDLARVLQDSGLPAVEITFRAAGAPGAIAAIRSGVPGILVAAGTVLTIDQARSALDAGAQLVVAPGTNRRIVEFVLAREAIMVPGVATPSDIESNLEYGIRTMKLFPAEVLGGTKYITALAGPYREVGFVPTGGVSVQNLASYLSLPAVTACGGTWVASKTLLEQRNWQVIGAHAREAATIVAEGRSPSQSP
jgi:2-dehydro-3-deoxyphosphogluconate aldolase / (4S)-4-hydroxy-2-oxoglutarate aldolase